MAYIGLLARLSPRPERTFTADQTRLHAADSCSTSIFVYDEEQQKHKTVETHHFARLVCSSLHYRLLTVMDSPLARGGLGKCLSAPPIHIHRYQQEVGLKHASLSRC